MKKNM